MKKVIKLTPLLLLIIFMCPIALSADINKAMSIYLDVTLDAKERELTLAKKYKAKDIVLNTGKKLQVAIEAKNYAVQLSRVKDYFGSVDERLAEAKKKGSKVYVQLQITPQAKNCITIFVPKKEQGSGSKDGTKINLDKIMEDLTFDDKREESFKLADLMINEMKNKSPSFCMGIDSKSNYVLENAASPVVIVDFGVSDSISPYVLDSAFMDKIIAGISEGLNEYISSLKPRK